MGAVFLTALSGLVPESAEAGVGAAGDYHSEDCIVLSEEEIYCWIDPPAAKLFGKGRLTTKFSRGQISIGQVGWFGTFSNQPQTPPPETGNGLFPDRNAPFNLLDPNPQLKLSFCTANDFRRERECTFNPFQPVNGKFDSGFDFDFATEEFLAIDFDPGSEGLEINTDQSFNFLGIRYDINQNAFSDDPLAGIRLVKPGAGDFGLVLERGFNAITCSFADATSGFPEICGEQNPPDGKTLITQSEVLAASSRPGFRFNKKTNEGFFPNGDPFQVIDGSFIPHEKVDEPHNNLGLIALGAFGANFILKRRRKQQKSS